MTTLTTRTLSHKWKFGKWGPHKVADFVGRGGATERADFGTFCPKGSIAKFVPTSPKVNAPPNRAAFFMSGALSPGESEVSMEFFSSAVNTLQTLVVALGAGLAVWGVINLLEGYGSDNPGAKSQGIKQLMAGGGIIVLGMTLIPLLSGLF